MAPNTRWRLAAPLFTAVHQTPQGHPPPQPPPRRFPAPPDHWMTMDGLTQTVGLSPRQQSWVADPYAALNRVMREAAARRSAAREALEERLAGRQPQELSGPEREALRAEADRSRAALEGYQAEAELWHGTIRSMLTTAQQEKFDVLPRPVVMLRTPRGAPPAP